jgi:hypothetical protein
LRKRDLAAVENDEAVFRASDDRRPDERFDGIIG